MGSCLFGLARDRRVFSGSVQILATPNFQMKLMKIFPYFLSLIVFCVCSPLDLGYGGVYDSPAAQEYWARRFGFLFNRRSSNTVGSVGTSSLRALQESINQRALSNRRISRP